MYITWLECIWWLYIRQDNINRSRKVRAHTEKTKIAQAVPNILVYIFLMATTQSTVIKLI